VLAGPAVGDRVWDSPADLSGGQWPVFSVQLRKGDVMSVCGYFGRAGGWLRLKGGDFPAGRVEGQVLEGGLSVEEALSLAARRAWGVGEAYESAADYDPVLRSHCRLDEKGEEL
jgi:hypothetical protein